MSEISAWRDATGDMDDVVYGPEVETSSTDAVVVDEASAEPTPAEADDSIQAELEAALADAEADTFAHAPTEPMLLLADHSGEGGADDHDELEHGIASVIASLYADSRDDSVDEAAAEAEEADP